MSPREAMWAKVVVLYNAFWPGRATLTRETMLAMEASGLSVHEPDAVLAAVQLAGRNLKFPPSLAELLESLEGVERRVPVYRVDVWNRVILGNDGAPIVKAWKTERDEPAAYRELRRAKGLPEPTPAPKLPYRPPANLDRPEHDGEPRPVLPASIIDGLVKKAKPS